MSSDNNHQRSIHPKGSWKRRQSIWLLAFLAVVQFRMRTLDAFFTIHQPRNGRKALAALSSAATTDMEPFFLHPIDYSAANEYIAEHYKHVFKHDSYFENGADSGPFDEENHDINKPIEPIYNARQGILSDCGKKKRLPTLETDGFTLLQVPTSVADWNDLPQIKARYIPELRRMIDATIDHSEDITHIVFWNPVLRGENQGVSNVERDMSSPNPPTSPTAGMVHVDQDVGAYDTETIVKLVENNRLLVGDDKDDFKRNEIIEAIENGSRFAVVNFWRSADLDHPIQRQPLAVFLAHYQNANSDDNRAFYFPIAKPDPFQSRWYVFPDMTPDEVLVFKQYDRDGSFPSDVWHCALKSITKDDAPPRQSFDIRALLVFKSKVEKNDRFGQDRVRPVLDYQESGEFCDQQAEQRARLS